MSGGGGGGGWCLNIILVFSLSHSQAEQELHRALFFCVTIMDKYDNDEIVNFSYGPEFLKKSTGTVVSVLSDNLSGIKN